MFYSFPSCYESIVVYIWYFFTFISQMQSWIFNIVGKLIMCKKKPAGIRCHWRMLDNPWTFGTSRKFKFCKLINILFYFLDQNYLLIEHLKFSYVFIKFCEVLIILVSGFPHGVVPKIENKIKCLLNKLIGNTNIFYSYRLTQLEERLM